MCMVHVVNFIENFSLMQLVLANMCNGSINLSDNECLTLCIDHTSHNVLVLLKEKCTANIVVYNRHEK